MEPDSAQGRACVLERVAAKTEYLNDALARPNSPRSPIKPQQPIPILEERIGRQNRQALAGILMRKRMIRFRDREGTPLDRSARELDDG